MTDRKKLFHLLFAFALTLGLLTAMSITVFAGAPSLSIGDNNYSSSNHGEGWRFELSQDGSGILTLNDFTYNHGDASKAISWDGGTDGKSLTIIVSGTNTIRNTYNASSNYGISAYGNLHIQGNGYLEVFSEDVEGDSISSTGIHVNSGHYLDIREGVTLTVQSGSASGSGSDSTGISCDQFYNYGADVTVSSEDATAFSCGITAAYIRKFPPNR